VVEPFKIQKVVEERSQGTVRAVTSHGTKERRPQLETLGRRKSLVSVPRSWMERMKGGSDKKNAALPKVPPLPPSLPISIIKPVKSKSSVVSYQSSWNSSSRSPSPARITKQDIADSSVDGGSTTASSVSSASPKKAFSVLSGNSEKSPQRTKSESPTRGLVRRGTLLLKKSKRPESGFFDLHSARSSTNSSAVSLGDISSLNSSAPGSSAGILPNHPKTFSSSKLSNLGISSTHRRDELWSAFRSLDTDFSKFQNKTSALKTNVVRSTVLPFLRNHPNDTTCKDLLPEDLDRRVNIFNKWWVGLLDMLDNQNGQSVSGVDRPIILDAITGIMVRPEWRQPPSYFAPLRERTGAVNKCRRQSTASDSTASSQYIADSVYHNVRQTFIRNLQAQMSMIVDKMSLRHAPASLVAFCGKAVAYAWFFCPGVADALARVWKMPFETIQRVANEFEVGRRAAFTVGDDDVVAAFPPNLHSLGWTSAKGLVNLLRGPAVLPPDIAKISWQGPWAGRWCGRDSDLFYVFAKHYHILLAEFLEPEAPLSEKALAPGFILVNAQLLTILDGTIKRQPDPIAGPNALLDEFLTGADARAAALPLSPSSNLSRLMCENRLIMLLRDFLSEGPSGFGNARLLFAEAFGHIMRASAKRISIYEHHSCYILCDFMEEALPIFIRYHQNSSLQTDFTDWAFWLEVCKKMLESQNSMTEIRLFSFIYGSWNLIVGDASRKEVFCLQWLLSEDTFRKFLLHWCPMVRSYYMRLLCWRVCRFEGEASELDTKIFQTVLLRLRSVWKVYQHQKSTASKTGMHYPSSTPCHPAPGRRLLIIRNDTQPPAASLFLSFDGILSPTVQQSNNKRNTLLAANPNFVLPKDTSIPATQKKRWSMIPKMFTPASDNLAPTANVEAKLERARLATASARARPTSMVAPSHKSTISSSSSESGSSSPTLPYRAFAFKFSLEWHPGQTMTHAQRAAFSRDRKLGSPQLPAPAQRWINGIERHDHGAGEALKAQSKAREIKAEKRMGDVAMEKYAGRALAEWALLVLECNNFVERRGSEGVPNLRLMEVPTLGVDGFKKYC
jgi:hypothetical protein